MSNLTNNTTELQAVLEILENKATGSVLPELSNEGTAADLLEGKEFIDGQGNKIVGTLSLDAEMAAQAELIESIKIGLEGKTGGGGGTTESITGCHLIVGDDITYIDDGAFRGSAITNLTIGNNVISIGSEAFSDCVFLTTVTISDSVTTMGAAIFSYCESLEVLTIKAVTPPSLSGRLWGGVPGRPTIYVPAESVDAYKSATNWAQYADYIQAIPT